MCNKTNIWIFVRFWVIYPKFYDVNRKRLKSYYQLWHVKNLGSLASSCPIFNRDTREKWFSWIQIHFLVIKVKYLLFWLFFLIFPKMQFKAHLFCSKSTKKQKSRSLCSWMVAFNHHVSVGAHLRARWGVWSAPFNHKFHW